MAVFDDFWTELQTEFTAFVGSTWGAYVPQALQDGQTFLEKSKNDLIRWTELVAENKLTLEDVEWLVMGKKDLAELLLLTQLGLAKVTLERFINGLLGLIISTLQKTFL